MSFDGNDDYVNLNSKPISGVQNTFSIASKFKLNSVSNGQGIYFHRGHYKDIGIRYESTDGLLHFLIITSTTGQYHTTASVNPNEWYYVVGTYDGFKSKLYVNGVLIDSNQFTENIDWDDSWTAEWIGGGTDGQSQPLNGLIDRTEVWNKPLNQLEIQEYMSCPPSGNETGLVGFGILTKETEMF